MKPKFNASLLGCSPERWGIPLLFLGLLLAGGCATTGDPNQDTIFWSEKKAQQRLTERQSSINAQNQALVQERNRGAALQAQLDESERKDEAIRTALRQAQADLSTLIREQGIKTGEADELQRQLSNAARQLSEIHPNAQEIEEMKRKRAALEAQVTGVQQRLRILMGGG